jgi:hypothetical protein
LLLDKNTIVKKGTPQEMATYVTEVKKFDVGKSDEGPGEPQPMQRAKTQAKRDRESDLRRATGDFSLYSKHSSQTLATRSNGHNRILPLISWSSCSEHGRAVHGDVLFL